ncbi:M56 family metallopeptidase, partial [Marilutibacter aestuarii]
MTDLAATLVPALAGTLLAFLWQGALVGVLAWLALALLRDARPQARYAVACLALLACLVLPASHLLRALSAPVHEAPIMAAGVASAPDARVSGFQSDTPGMLAPVLRLDAGPILPPDVLPWVVALWAAGAGLLALRMGLGLHWVQRLQATSHDGGDDGWQRRVDAMARALGIRRHVAWRVLAKGDSPLSVGWWRPVVMVPAALVLRMPTPLLEALVAHELAHVRRHDYLVNLLQGVVEVLLFYHPVTWWLSRRIRVEREQVADDLAATLIGEPRRLAIALSELDRCTAPVPNPALAAHGGQLMSRIQQLVRPQRNTLRGVVALPLVAMAIAGLAIAH